MPDAGHIFISYSRNDGNAYAERLERDLQAAGYTTWRDTRNIDAYQDFTAELEKAIEAASQVVVCITPDTKRDNSFVRREIGYALVNRKRIVPIMFADIVPPITIVNLQGIEFWRLGWDEALNQLVSVLRGEITRSSGRINDPFAPYLEELRDEVDQYFEQTVLKYIPLNFTIALDKANSDLGQEESQNELQNNDAIDFSNLIEAFAYFQGRVLLLGEPGSGKTTTLMHLARQAIKKRLEDPDASLPIVARVSDWNPDSELSVINWISRIVDHQLRPLFDQLVSNGKVLFLLDALDELGSERREQKSKTLYDPRKKFLEQLPLNNSILLTSRAKDFYEIDIKAPLIGAVILSPLTSSQIEYYLENTRPEILDLLNIDGQLKELFSTPLLLNILAFAGANKGAETASDFKPITLRYLAAKYHYLREVIQYPLQEVVKQLTLFATYLYMQPWKMYANMPASSLNSYEMAQTPLDPKIIELCVTLQLGIIRDIGGQTITFMSNLFRDSLVYESLLNYVSSEDNSLRFGAVRSLGLLESRSAIPHLQDAWNDEKDLIIRYAIRTALERLNSVNKVFVSYRRKDWGITLLLIERLRTTLDANLFFDNFIDRAKFQDSLFRNIDEANELIQPFE